MYKWFRVKNFRCFRDLEVSDLARVNLIAGKNNVGKTALLEALFVHLGGYNPALALQLSGLRGIQSVRIELGAGRETPWDLLFTDFDISQPIELSGQTEREGCRTLRVEVVAAPQGIVQVRSTVPGSTTGAEQTVLEMPVSSDVLYCLRLSQVHADGHEEHCDLVFGREGARMEPSPPPPPFPGHFITSGGRPPLVEDQGIFSELGRERRERVLVESLSVLEPRLKDLRLFDHHGQTIIHGDIGLSRMLPLPFMGEGMTRLCSLLLRMWRASSGVVLVDEIENGLHHSVLGKVWTAIGEAARRFNTQVFATTHSWECVVAAHQAFSEGEQYDFRLHRLDWSDGQITAVTYDQETLAAAIDADFEVR